MIPILAAVAAAALKGALVVALAAAAAYLLRHRSAASRHAIWTGALAAHLILVFAAPLLPTWSVPSFRMPSWLTQQAGVGAPVAGAPSDRGPVTPAPIAPTVIVDVSPSPSPTPSPSASAAVIAEGTLTSSQAHKLTSTKLTSPKPVTLWLVGALLVFGRLLLGTLRVATVARASERVTDGAWLSLFQRLSNELRITRPLTLMRGDRLDVPVTWGVVYPVVLLPVESEEWSTERRRFVLVHEMAHVKRLDALTQLVAQLTVAIFWFDPLVWLAARRMRAEREHACDDYVLRSGTRASLYADELLDMVRRLGRTTRNTAAAPAFAALAMARRSEFEGRMLAILDPVADRHTLSRAGSLAGALLALLLLVPLAALRPFEDREAMAVTPAVAAEWAMRNPITIPLTVSVDRRASAIASAKALVLPPAPRPPRPLYQCTEAEIREKGSGYHMRREDVTSGRQVLEYMTRKVGRCVHVLIVGGFRLTNDERDIAQLSPGGRAQFHDLVPGRERELTIVRDDDGTLRRTYMENGKLATYAGGAQEWIAMLVQELAREGGANAPERVARLRRQGGVPAVLAEISNVRSSGAKRKHYEALLASGAFTPGEVDSIVRHAGRELAESSGDLRAVLRLVPPGGVRAVNSALEGAIGRMADGDKVEVLSSMLKTTDPATLGVVLRLGEQIGSDGDKATLLRRAAPRVLDGSNDALRDAFFRTYATIGSDSDKQSVLVTVVREVRPSTVLTRDVLRGATRIGSDGDKASVLLTVVRGKLVTTSELREEYIKAARTISSDGDYRAVIDAVLGGKTGS